MKVRVCYKCTIGAMLMIIAFGACQKVKKKKETVQEENTVVQAKSLIDYFQPMPIGAPLISEGIWGDANVLPRDTTNGLEDATLENWCYWDGGIIKDDEGLYHIYASRWSQTFPHSSGWKKDSKAVHAVSDNMYGPYTDDELIWPHWNGGKAANVNVLRMHDGRYAVVTSEITKGEVFASDSPNGPFELLGDIKVDMNGFDSLALVRYDDKNAGAVKAGTVGNMANVVILLRPDGRYMLVPRSCSVLISDEGILGPYKVMSGPVYKGIKELPQEKMEDPTIWYSGGLYHLVVNHWRGGDVSYHLSSKDGITDWKYRGIAFDKEAGIFEYTNGVQNYWKSVQRMTVYVEDGHPKLFHFSAVDAGKAGDQANDNNGSKIITVPFDGEAFDRDMGKSDSSSIE